MRMMLNLGVILLMAACTTTPPQKQGQTEKMETTVAPGESAEHAAFAKIWFKGTVEQAMSQAKETNKPVFLYWGAVWCPPCNELKKQVFIQSRFQDLMTSFVPVYLDGDTEQAQVWGDKLKVSGYPTVLVLLPDGKEISRISGDVNIEEFETTVAGILAAKRPLMDTIHLALKGKASDEDWKVLTYVSWGQIDDKNLKDASGLKTRMELIQKIPTHLTEARSILSAGLLEDAASMSENPDSKAVKQLTDKIRKNSDRYVGYILTDAKTKLAARRAVVYSGGAIAGWLFPKAKGKNYPAFKSQWLASVHELVKSPMLTVDNRLWAAYAPVEFYRLENPKNSLPETLVTEVRNAVKTADADAKSAYERHSVISGAAFMLGEVGDFDGGRALLEKELKTTDTPWYYQSSLANLEMKNGNEEAALKWSEEARKSAQGRATKLQWLVSDLAMVAKTKSANQEKQLGQLAKEYYELAFSLTDGFAGRNASAAKKVAKNLKDHKNSVEVAALVKAYVKQCAQLGEPGRQACEGHFKSLK